MVTILKDNLLLLSLSQKINGSILTAQTACSFKHHRHNWEAFSHSAINAICSQISTTDYSHVLIRTSQ